MTDAELVSELRSSVERSHPAWSMAPTVLAAAEAIERLTARLTLAQVERDEAMRLRAHQALQGTTGEATK